MSRKIFNRLAALIALFNVAQRADYIETMRGLFGRINSNFRLPLFVTHTQASDLEAGTIWK